MTPEAMTPKQQERLQNKIKKIKAALAADKREWGGQYRDGQGRRYLPPTLYLQLGDYAGGLRYLNWFNKNFPDDSGYPDFLFEWTILLFKAGKLKQAEEKAFETFCGNTYLFDVFFDRPVRAMEKREFSNLETLTFASQYFHYRSTQAHLEDFADWLRQLQATEKFSQACAKYLDVQKR